MVSNGTGFSGGTGRDQGAFMAARIPSFTHFLSSYAPEMLPGARTSARWPGTGRT